MMPNFQRFKGKQQCFELCKTGKWPGQETAPIVDIATSKWGAFEYVNKGTITKDLASLGAVDSDFKLVPDTNALVGEYAVAVCFRYWLNSKGKIYRVHEFLDLEN